MCLKPVPQIPRRLAARQEAVLARLLPLARQVQGQARNAPSGAVPAPLRSAAEALLIDVQRFGEQRRKPLLPQAAPNYGGLATQLAEALTVLIAFETRHTQWNAAVGDSMWLVPGPMMKVRRLMPRPGSKAAARAEARARQEQELRAARMVDIRAKLVQRLAQFRQREPMPDLAP